MIAKATAKEAGCTFINIEVSFSAGSRKVNFCEQTVRKNKFDRHTFYLNSDKDHERSFGRVAYEWLTHVIQI